MDVTDELAAYLTRDAKIEPGVHGLLDALKYSLMRSKPCFFDMGLLCPQMRQLAISQCCAFSPWLPQVERSAMGGAVHSQDTSQHAQPVDVQKLHIS